MTFRDRRRDPTTAGRTRLTPTVLLAALAFCVLATSAAAVAPPEVPPPAVAPTAAAHAPRPPSVGFGKPYEIAKPQDRDLIPVQIGYSSAGGVAVASGRQDEDNAGASTAALAIAAPLAPFSSLRTVPAAQQILAIAYRGAVPEVLVGTSPMSARHPPVCCSEVEALRAGTRGSFGARHTVVTGLAGATTARLVPVGGGLLAAIASTGGVWAAQSDTKGRFGPTESLAPAGSVPQALSATAFSDGRTIVVWTALSAQNAPGPITIDEAEGTSGAVPGTPQVAITVPSTHEIDELAVAAHGTVPDIAWVESWYDRDGAYHSQVFSEDLVGKHVAQPVSPVSVLASGLTLSAAADGDEVLAFRTCTTAGACTVQAATRKAGRFTAPTTLGPIDGTQTPVAAESPTGFAMVGWVNSLDDVLASVAPPATGRFARPYLISASGYAADLALAFAPSGTGAIAVWTQGTLHESIVASNFTAPAVAAPVVKAPPAKPVGATQPS